MESLGFLMYYILSVICRQQQFYFCLSNLGNFYFLIIVAEISDTILNKCGKNEHACLVPNLKGNTFSFSPLIVMLAISLFYMGFIMLKYVPSITILLRKLINVC